MNLNIEMCLQRMLSVVNWLLLFCISLIIAICLYTTNTWGSVDIPQLLFFLYADMTGVDVNLLWQSLLWCLAVPVVVTHVMLCILKNFNSNAKPIYPTLFILTCCALYWGLCNYIWNLSFEKQIILYVIFFAIYMINQRGNFNPVNVFLFLLWIVPVVFFIILSCGCGGLFTSFFNFKKTDIYAQRYTDIRELQLSNQQKRNIILIFGESLESKFLSIPDEKFMKINDEQAVKFNDFTEGYVQRWTQGALFSAFTGVHIHYVSELFKYKIYRQLKDEFDEASLITHNSLTNRFDFNTPNITYLGDVMADAGYQNLFVQGGELAFSGTDKFLTKHGFSGSNIYDIDFFKNTYEYQNKKNWWGVPDTMVFNTFKEKISKLDKNKPFFAVMFTLDLHLGNNPFFESEEDIQKTTINNINDFITWFKNQSFYENTTLIIIADHKKTGEDVKPGGGLYNAFFNLPSNLYDKLNVNRSFNQIDVFPTILEIAGFNLPEHRAGMGVSLFSGEKTLAEIYSYEEQEKMFSKIDGFYQLLWSDRPLQLIPFRINYLLRKTPKELLIAHAGGKVPGMSYANSKKALQLSTYRGYKFIELDLLKTKDNRIVAGHDWQRISIFRTNKDVATCCSFSDFNTTEKGILYDDRILDFFVKHPNIYLVTDKIDDFTLLKEKFYPIQHRMIVEVFSKEKYEEAKHCGFRYVTYNIKNEHDFKIVENEKYALVTMDINMARKYLEQVKQLRKSGVIFMLYSVDNPRDVKQNCDIGDIFYYDGEEIIN